MVDQPANSLLWGRDRLRLATDAAGPARRQHRLRMAGHGRHRHREDDDHSPERMTFRNRARIDIGRMIGLRKYTGRVIDAALCVSHRPSQSLVDLVFEQLCKTPGLHARMPILHVVYLVVLGHDGKMPARCGRLGLDLPFAMSIGSGRSARERAARRRDRACCCDQVDTSSSWRTARRVGMGYLLGSRRWRPMRWAASGGCRDQRRALEPPWALRRRLARMRATA